MRIAFIWDWQMVPSQTITWKDGLAAAVKELCKKYDVRVFTMGGEYIFPHDYFPIYRDWETDRKSTRLNSSHSGESRMPSSA